MRHEGQTHPGCLVVQPSRLHMQAGRLRYKEGDRDVRYQAVLVTRSVNSTVDIFQSVSNATFHSYLSESRGGPGNVTFRGREGGGVGAGKKEFEGVNPPECSPPARSPEVPGIPT